MCTILLTVVLFYTFLSLSLLLSPIHGHDPSTTDPGPKWWVDETTGTRSRRTNPKESTFYPYCYVLWSVLTINVSHSSYLCATTRDTVGIIREILTIDNNFPFKSQKEKRGCVYPVGGGRVREYVKTNKVSQKNDTLGRGAKKKKLC